MEGALSEPEQMGGGTFQLQDPEFHALTSGGCSLALLLFRPGLQPTLPSLVCPHHSRHAVEKEVPIPLASGKLCLEFVRCGEVKDDREVTGKQMMAAHFLWVPA